MPLKDFLNGYQYDPENFDFEKFKADALKEHVQDESVFNAKIQDSDEKLTEFDKQLRAQKLKNYELLDKIPANGNTLADQRQEQIDEADVSIDDLFGTKERADA